jgi:aldehyde dehydrogenase (NAD+)
VMRYVEIGKAEGARLVTGGEAGAGPGYYIKPTLFADVTNQMCIAQEEIFGPVLVAIPHDGDDDAVRLANESLYGLGGAVQSASNERALKVALRIRTGTLNLNNANAFGADAPFGGYKQSGIGREMGVEGFEEYLQTKTIGIEA